MAGALDKAKNFRDCYEAEEFVDHYITQKDNIKDFYRKGIEELPVRWQKCINQNGG